MNAVTIALSNVGHNISPEILNLAFREQNQMINTAISIDEMIMTKVLRPRVMVDANLVSGIHLAVNLDHCTIEEVGLSEYIVTVPKTVTNNRSLITALSIIPGSAVNIMATQSPQRNPALITGLDMMNSVSNEGIIHTTRLELIGENKVLIKDPTMTLYGGILRCVVENDINMSNLNPRSFPVFSTLVIYAVKAYIYNQMVVKINQGFIYGGHDLGIVKEIIDSYADSNELYNDYLVNTFQKVGFMNDSEKHGKFIAAMIGGGV